ncbi:hypothetical protein BST33_06385 [Mycolicibacter minnesotensis]|uniref:Uncharacterized protein n=1 Tax=Mycolicibacter minnesotensis TaxID=1118379 RepID=A0A7I7R3A5_9MYCO|nr:hypothetical protein BST33_06385 [Mycolicibacter minnesotensis]BBY32610.1 hypothetical protein MMIN_06710 [Mycolicibacter minnesotensis]
MTTDFTPVAAAEVAGWDYEVDVAIAGFAMAGAAAEVKAARGDPVLHKKAQWLKPVNAPVGAIDLRECTGGFTLGALATTLDAQVLRVSGEPLAGL